MPKIKALLSEEDLKKRSPNTSQQDLSAYVQMLEDALAQNAKGATVELEESDVQRIEKRRFTTAAKMIGRKLEWRQAPAGELKFVLSDEKGELPAKRPRKSKTS